MFSQRYFEAYHAHIPKSAPEEDYDDRNALYSLYVHLCLRYQQAQLTMLIQQLNNQALQC